jgi:hypothetical protein
LQQTFIKPILITLYRTLDVLNFQLLQECEECGAEIPEQRRRLGSVTLCIGYKPLAKQNKNIFEGNTMRLKFDEKHIGWAIMAVLFIASILAIFRELMS